MMLEAIFAVGVLLFVVTVIAAFMRQENIRQQRQLIASEMRTLMTSSRDFIAQSYTSIREDMLTAANSGQAIVAYEIGDLVDNGYLPPSFSGGILEGLHGQSYAILARAVSRSDTAVPKSTMTASQIDADGNGEIDATLVDTDFDNDEMDIEAILVSYGGEALSRSNGGAIVSMSRSPFSGLVTEAGISSGPYGNFSVDITPFAGRESYPEIGHFASLLAISGFGVFDEDGTQREFIPDPFRRCRIEVGTSAYEECIENNNIYNDIVLMPHDSDNDGEIDTYPALRNVTTLDCGDGEAAGVANTFLIDCQETRLTGNLAIPDGTATIGDVEIDEAGLSISGSDVLRRRDIGGEDRNLSSPDRMVMNDLNGGQDMSEALVDSRVVRARETVSKPQCPATTLDGVPMAPRIYVSPAAYSDPDGRAIIGVRAYAEDVDDDNWRVRLMAFVGQDYCTNDISTAILFPDANDDVEYDSRYGRAPNGPPGVPDRGICSNFDVEGDVVSDQSDGRADVYEMNAAQGAVIAQTRCY